MQPFKRKENTIMIVLHTIKLPGIQQHMFGFSFCYALDIIIIILDKEDHSNESCVTDNNSRF